MRGSRQMAVLASLLGAPTTSRTRSRPTSYEGLNAPQVLAFFLGRGPRRQSRAGTRRLRQKDNSFARESVGPKYPLHGLGQEFGNHGEPRSVLAPKDTARRGPASTDHLPCTFPLKGER